MAIRKPEDRAWKMPVECVRCGGKDVIELNPDDYIEFRSIGRKRMIQDIFPYLTASEREILMSGYCDDCYDEIFSVKDDITGEK